MASAKETDNGENKSRKRLRPLLQKFLNENTVPHLSWTDREKKIWKLPWKHHKQTRWGDPDAFMLRELAKHLYGYNGPSEPEKGQLKHWKELIRNALRSLKDIKELEEMHVKEGDSPYKVYQFVDLKNRSFKRGQISASQELQVTKSEKAGQGLDKRMVFIDNASDSSSGLDISNSSSIPQFPLLLGTTSLNLVNEITVGTTNSSAYSDHASCLFKPTSLFSFNTFTDSHLQAAVTDIHPQIDDLSDISSENLTPFVGEDAWKELLSSLSSNNFAVSSNSFRSRSPLSHDSEQDNHFIHSQKPQFDSDHVPPSRHRIRDSAPATRIKVTDLNETQNKNSAMINFSFSACVNTTSLVNDKCAVDKSKNSPIDTDNEKVINSLPVSASDLQADIFNQQIYLSSDKIIQVAPPSSLIVCVYYHTPFPAVRKMLTGKFRICFFADTLMRENIKQSLDSQQPGQSDALMLELPPPGTFSELHPVHVKNTQKVLNNLARGVVIDPRDQDIYATRYCKAVAHFSHPDQADFQKMERFKEIKIFDFRDLCKDSSKPHHRHSTDIMKPNVRLSFAVKDTNTQSSLTVDIWHVDAFKMAMEKEERLSSLEPECSISDDYDTQLETQHLIRKTVLTL